MTFKQAFFRIYDQKIASGQLTFSRSGISKNDFTRLCTEADFVLDVETLKKLAVTMELSEEELNLLLACAEEEQK